MAVSDEFMMLVLAFAVNHILIMNQGVNISNLRRFVGATLTMIIGATAILVTNQGTLELGQNAPSFVIAIISVIYFIFQLTIIITKMTKEIDEDELVGF